MSRNIDVHTILFQEHGICLRTRTLLIDGDEDSDNFEITEKSARRDIKNIHTLDTLAPSGDRPITVILNCNGGCVLAGMAIYDALSQCLNRVIIKAHTAMSMGSLILQAGDERLLYPNATVMIHNGEVSRQGSPKTVENWAAYDRKMDKIHEDIYLSRIKLKKPRFTREQLQKMLEHDTILSASQAINIGLADSIIGI
jgi:ATP-dependent Clp protease protease subunit